MFQTLDSVKFKLQYHLFNENYLALILLSYKQTDVHLLVDLANSILNTGLILKIETSDELLLLIKCMSFSSIPPGGRHNKCLIKHESSVQNSLKCIKH